MPHAFSLQLNPSLQYSINPILPPGVGPTGQRPIRGEGPY